MNKLFLCHTTPVATYIGMTAAVLTAAVLMPACSVQKNATSADLKNVPYTDPDSIHVWINIDGHPNVARLCLDGVAFATTTRAASPASLMRVVEWDRFCPAPKSPVLTPK